MALLRCVTPRLASGAALRLRVTGLLLSVLLLSAPQVPAQTTPSPDYQLKAIFLFNFSQFVEWPPEAFPEIQTPLVIGVLGDDPFGSYLDETVVGENAKSRSLTVQRYRQLEEIRICHVLFISRSEIDRLDQILAGLKGRHILTVGDTDSFAARGGMIRFVTERNKLRLKINLEPVKAAKLTISSKLLRPAEIVRPRQN